MHRFSVITALAALLVSAPLAAQGVPEDTTTAASIVVAAQPSIDFTARWTPASAALRAAPSAAPSALAPMFVPQPTGRSKAMMVVGGAAILFGAVVGDDAGQIIMIGGGVVGLLGLWEYLK
jgi:hypothetical protein